MTPESDGGSPPLSPLSHSSHGGSPPQSRFPHGSHESVGIQADEDKDHLICCLDAEQTSLTNLKCQHAACNIFCWLTSLDSQIRCPCMQCQPVTCHCLIPS
jgi:hypothetical protein